MQKRRLHVLLLFLFVLCLAFYVPLVDLFSYALCESLYSHVILIPFVSLYLLHSRRKALPLNSQPSPFIALVLCLVAAMAPFILRLAETQGLTPAHDDYLCLAMFSFVTFIVGAVFLAAGGTWFRAAAFPVLFLYFLMPMPVLIRDGFDIVLQRASAITLLGLLKLTGTPVFREGMVFSLPGLTVEVAKECSGIRSSLVLLITALVAGDMFLRSGRRKVVLALSFFPIAALRNAVRILAVSLLTIHVDPGVIKGPLHRQGGPPFFVLSLIPLFVILVLLRKSERSVKRRSEAGGGVGETGPDQVRRGPS